MEKILDTKLFLRDTRRVALTPAGANLLPAAQKLVDQFDKLPDVVTDNPDHPLKMVAYSVPPWLHAGLINRLARLDEIYSERLILVRRRRTGRETVASILRKDLAFGFARPPASHPELGSIVVREDRVGAVLCKSAYGSRSSVSLQELRELEYLTDRRDGDTEYRRLVDAALESAGIRKRARLAPGDHLGAAAAIGSGRAFAIAPLSADDAPGYDAAEHVCLPIDDLDFTLMTCLVWSKDLAEEDRATRDVVDTAIALCRGPRGLPHPDSA